MTEPHYSLADAARMLAFTLIPGHLGNVGLDVFARPQSRQADINEA